MTGNVRIMTGITEKISVIIENWPEILENWPVTLEKWSVIIENWLILQKHDRQISEIWREIWKLAGNIRKTTCYISVNINFKV